MTTRTIILAVLALLFLTSCDRSPAWPPNRSELMYVFDQHKSTFELIEREMSADGLRRMGPVIYSQTHSTPTIIKLPSGQASKYQALFGRTQMFIDVTRHEQSTAFELLLQNDGTRLYLSRFVHAAVPKGLPRCASVMQAASCGACAIRIERGWMLEYDWFPADPEVEARECRAPASFSNRITK
ncbi:MAG: hypothetical protein R3192_08915 [Woeseiaceae bacterium]|nr:hypothetical protein [Woeseiaceae bacterium]